VIYEFPLYDIRINYQLLYFYYLNEIGVNNEKNVKNYMKRCVNEFDYNYLTEKILLEHRACKHDQNKETEIQHKIR
jgi:hypothetical protein